MSTKKKKKNLNPSFARPTSPFSYEHKSSMSTPTYPDLCLHTFVFIATQNFTAPKSVRVCQVHYTHPSFAAWRQVPRQRQHCTVWPKNDKLPNNTIEDTSTPPPANPVSLTFDPLRMRLLPSSRSAVRHVTALECPVKITLQRRVLRSHIRTWLSSPLSRFFVPVFFLCGVVDSFDGLKGLHTSDRQSLIIYSQFTI